MSGLEAGRKVCSVTAPASLGLLGGPAHSLSGPKSIA